MCSSDLAMWLDKGSVKAIGKTDHVVHQYLAAMAAKDREYMAHDLSHLVGRERVQPEEVVVGIPNIDHRFGDGKAEIEREGGAAAQGAREMQLPTHQLHEVSADRQPEPGAAVLARDRRVGLHELLEEPFLRGVVDADAGVAHGEAEGHRVRVATNDAHRDRKSTRLNSSH